MSRRVTVLKGGYSAEREVSLNSGAAAAAALSAQGYAVAEIDVPRDPAALVEALRKTRPDVVFNALHGRFGEDGRIQGLLDIMGLPYTHSGALASAMAMDKPTAKAAFSAAGIPVAEHVVVGPDAFADPDVEPMTRPYVVKPLNEGSSVDVHVVLEGVNDLERLRTAWPYGRRAMVERFIPGRELTVSVMGQGDGVRALAVTEITTRRGFYDYDAKYVTGGSVHVLPADLPAGITARCLDLAVRSHQALGCRGVSRADLRLDGDALYVLEVNTQPGMTATSLVPEQAAYVGISFPELCAWMVEDATCDG
ncbi:D-alanine--D-alanine ligase [Roseospira marina]|uniref:D-alanine--D-alanine ligase n=1 Tax=Roseospira marina TaxID=140057 RepID=A0A5M6IA12_9PROT|nr:D-alanine--D-alanine ligase [Roseospira marina]KAA5604575.1 D-alanine--D-alanine ligase [Roseospira marina]MBB4315325.1 D-alanine-D-alanine ligase [Roseospira marina]MBB5088324.1 D-alanine-D-alanine ligase [Roseospira marina]